MSKVSRFLCWFEKVIRSISDKPGNRKIIVKDLNNSRLSLTVNQNPNIIQRHDFEPTNEWFIRLLDISYDNEIKSKYIPLLHQENKFERDELKNLLNFKEGLSLVSNQIRICKDYINRFRESHRAFYQVIVAEDITILDPHHRYFRQTDDLVTRLVTIVAELEQQEALFSLDNYKILSHKKNIVCTDTAGPVIDFYRDSWIQLLDKRPSDDSLLHYLFQHQNQIHFELEILKRMYAHFLDSSSNKIIAGPAGTGKTHMSAHLVTKILEQGDYILFFKPKQFSGDNINLSARILELLQVPTGYTLSEILKTLDDHAAVNNKRCFLIIDALNETTLSSIGFSTIWQNYLPDFISIVRQYPNLFLVCTLRTSYIEHIWSTSPASLIELEGLGELTDINKACIKYFDYYNINVRNIETADLRIFKVPLLLDLYCKIINEAKTETKEVTLGVNSYAQIFEDYIDSLINQVKAKLHLIKRSPIDDGFELSASLFYANNKAILQLDEFSGSFDLDPLVKIEQSIAYSVLEGYLIFIKDMDGKNEIVKHTHQEVGGFLLAKYLLKKFKSLKDLLSDLNFQEKIIGFNPSKEHQLKIDTLKFLIALHPKLILELPAKEKLRQSWWYLYNGLDFTNLEILPEYVAIRPSNQDDLEYILDISASQWLNIEHPYNFHYIADMIGKIDVWTFDMVWTFYLYERAEDISQFIDLQTENIREDEDDPQALKQQNLNAIFIAFTLATTIHELRDAATVFFVEFGKKFPIQLLELTVYSAKLSDTYIYERLSACCYGVAMIRQNDDQFIQKHLRVFASRLYDLQFSNNPKHPVLNYVVLDSIKHVIDLAIFKGVFELEKEQLYRLGKYQFPLKEIWEEPSDKQIKKINSSSDSNWPEPIGMDFGIYTIPRLVGGDYKIERKTIANVYKRILELGFKTKVELELPDGPLRDFFGGLNNTGKRGKVDRLGKKYCWKGFFDYAGVLLRQGKLNVFETEGDYTYYDRLSDVDIDISMPSKDYNYNERLYPDDLLADRNNNTEWYLENKIDSINPLFQKSFDGVEYIMLYGKVEQRVDDEYKIRSFMISDTVFIKKNEDFERIKQVVANSFFDWDKDLHLSPGHIRQTYFGELYWSDSMHNNVEHDIGIPTGETLLIKRKLKVHDLYNSARDYSAEDLGKEVEETKDENIFVESECTIAEYLWETDSNTIKGFSEFYPSIKMGKAFGLIADPQSGKILDAELKECYRCIDFNKGHFENKFNYIRADLIRKYMSDHNYALLYQIKQHSYDENLMHNRQMKFFILE